MALLGDIKIMMLKGEKGDKGDGSYDDTEIRGMIAQETADREEEIAEMERNFLNYLYPVGSIYMTVGTTSPAVLFGGTWVQIEDVFLMASSTSHPNGTTGGEWTATPEGEILEHILTENEIPSHFHNIKTTGIQSGSGDWGTGIATTGGNDYSTTSYGGAQGHSHIFRGSGHDIIPPYLAVNVWKRTA